MSVSFTALLSFASKEAKEALALFMPPSDFTDPMLRSFILPFFMIDSPVVIKFLS
jgi:hypothetical protein